MNNDNDDICKLCGLSDANKIPQSVYRTGERNPPEYVHAKCEEDYERIQWEEESEKAYVEKYTRKMWQNMTDEQRKTIIRFNIY